jgi:hypothetical protein
MKPLTEPERTIVSDHMATIEWIVIGRIPDHVIELLDRLIVAMELQPRRWSKFESLLGARLARANPTFEPYELSIVVEWFDMIHAHIDGRVSPLAIRLSTKLQTNLRSLAANDYRTWGRDFDKKVSALGLMR